MRFQYLVMYAILATWGGTALAYVPGKSPSGVDRYWPSGSIPVQLTGPTAIDGHGVLDSVRSATGSWNAIAHARIHLSVATSVDRREPSIGNGRNEFGWVESSDSPYFIPGIPCTTAYIYDTLTGVMMEADTTCNAMAYQWPDNLFGLATQDNVADAETSALAALGTWLGLDASLEYGDPMCPTAGTGRVGRFLLADEFAFGRQRYGDGTSPYGSISGTVRFPDGSPIPYAYVTANRTDGSGIYGAVADGAGAYTIAELVAASYIVRARPLTTDPYIESSVPYRANPIRNLDFSPEYYAGGTAVEVRDLAVTQPIDITAFHAGSDPDSGEPNDAAATATPLMIGFLRSATTHVPFDEDWYRFQTAPGVCYVIATALHGASIVPVPPGEAFWSRTRLLLHDGAALVGQNESRDELQLDPGNWLTYCETGSGRRLDVEVAPKDAGSGAGFFYTVWVRALAGGSTVTPWIDALYPSSGWANEARYVWIDGGDFMPGSTVDVHLPNGAWSMSVPASVTRCDVSYHCTAIKALFPAANVGTAAVRVTNPNGRTVTKSAAYVYVSSGQGPVVDRTPSAFGFRYGSGRAVCIGDYDGDGSEDIFKTRGASLPYQLFHNTGDGTFNDAAGSAGLRTYPPLPGESCSFIDIDDDGDLDIYTTNLLPSAPGGSSNEFYVNKLIETGYASFVRSTPSGLGGAAGRYQRDAAWADFDKDGRLDVVLVDDSYAPGTPYHDAVHYLRQNTLGGFTDLTSSSGLSGYLADMISVKAADFDNDGCDDLLFITFSGTANRLYKGNCHGHFANATSATHIADSPVWCAGVAVADFNNDGKIDIFCGTYNAGTGPARPRLWINNGSASFTDRAYEAGLWAVARNMTVVLPLDEDNDGLMDVYIGASDNDWPDDRKDVLLRNAGGNPPVFQDITDAATMYPTTEDGTGICVAGVDAYYCDRNAVAGGVFDWYADGGLDVFVTGDDPDSLQRGSDFLWRNRRNVIADGSIVPSNDWIEVALKGANTGASRVLSNRQGIGARVTVIPRFNLPGGAVPTETQCLQNPLPAGVTGTTREVTAGNQSQSSPSLHFGLGNVMPFDRKIVDCIKVAWPSGLERAYTGVIANSKVVLAENVARVKVIAVIPNSGENFRSDPTTITGLRFDRDVTEVPQVYFGTVPAQSVTFISEHELVVLPPLWQPPGTVDVTVVNTNGESDTFLAAYTYTGSSVFVRFKDPVPTLITQAGWIPNDPNLIAASGADRTGVIADGVTVLVLEAVVPGPGSVRFVLDDDDDPGNAPPPGTGVGTLTALGGGAPQTSLTVPAVLLADGRYIGHAIYVAPQDFIRAAGDKPLAMRPIHVRSTFIDAAHVESAMSPRTLGLYRVPVLVVHGMWGTTTTFQWPALNDPRWITYRADYADTNDATFAQNVGMPPRTVGELRKRINDLGIAGSRFFVFAHSMGAVLFKIFMSGTGAPYARADNFFAGDVYALVPVDAPFFGSYLAPYTRIVSSLPVTGPMFVETMGSIGKNVDRGCMQSLDPESSDVLDIPSAGGRFHGIVGWGGGEMRSAGDRSLQDSRFFALEAAFRIFDLAFDDILLRCDSGDDFIVCTTSQAGGLAGGYVDDFHYVDAASKAIHFDSITVEPGPSAAAEALLNTPTADASVWAQVLPKAPPPVHEESATIRGAVGDGPAIAPTSGSLPIRLAKQADSIVVTWTGAATRVFKSLVPTLAAGTCLAVSGSSFTDAHELTVPTNAYYEAGDDALCAPAGTLSVASVSPASGSALGGYRVTILGSGFGAGARVKVGPFFANEVVVVNQTTITCRMMPGAPGAATITVMDAGGQTASTSFTYIDPGPGTGSVRITAPVDGAAIAAGSTFTVTARGEEGFTIDRALVTSLAFAADDDLDPGVGFATSVTLPANSVGPVTIHLLARDASGHFLTATPVTINAAVPGNVALERLDAAKVTMLYASPTAQLRVYGVYSDGVRRELTHAQGIFYEMDTQDFLKPNYPYNGTGVAVVDAAGLVTAKTHGSTICHVTYAGLGVDVVIEVAELRPTMTILKPGLISWPYQGPGISYDLIRGKLTPLRATGGNFADPSLGLTCLKNNFTSVTVADAGSPPAGDGFFYLMRESRTSSYDESPFWATRSQVGQRTGSIAGAAGACP